MSIKPKLPDIDYTWRTELGFQARLVVVFTIAMIGFLIMLLFGRFHSRRPKKPTKKQVYVGIGTTASTITQTQPSTQKSCTFGDLKAITNKKSSGDKKKDALRSHHMRMVRAKRLRRDRERREEVAYIFQDVYPSDNGVVMWR